MSSNCRPDRNPGIGDADTTHVTVRNNSILIGAGGGEGISHHGRGHGHRIVGNAVRSHGK